MNQLTPNPPQWPLKFLRLFIKKEFLEEIEGDLEELFQQNVEQRSLRQARRTYAWEVLKLFRPVLLRNLDNIQFLFQYAIFKNYFTISIRSLKKNPLNSFINIFGLATAIGICVFVYGFARWTYSTDQFHKNKNEVYLITFSADRDGSVQQFGQTPRPLGEMLREDFTKIKKVCRVEDRNVILKQQDNVFHEQIRFTDPEFLDMFTFPLKQGAPSSLADVNSIILSDEMSIKYFGDQNPLGQSVLVKFDKDRSKIFKVTGVAKPFPKALTIQFDFLINFGNLSIADGDYDFHDWKAFVNATLIQVEDPSDLKAIENRMEKYRKLQNDAAKKEWAIASFAFEPLATLHERAGEIRDDISRSSSAHFKSIFFMSIIGLFMLALACFNYINIAIVSAVKRLKEIGVRKSIGATRRIVIVQFLSENIVITFFALILGLIIGATVLIPGFEQMNEFSMDFSLFDKNLWIYLPAILLLTGMASGIYPAFYVSKFQIVGILKGSVRFGQKNPLTKIFLGFQLILASILITCGVMFTQNSSYLAKRSWGYHEEGALYAEVADQAAYEKLNAAMVQDRNILSVSGSTQHLGRSHRVAILRIPGREYEVDQLSVDPHYFETMGLELTDGRNFHDHEGSDRQSAVVNDILVQNMGWKKPIGQQFEIDSIRFEVIGVLKEFHSYNFHHPVRPTVFNVANKADYRYLSVKVQPGTEKETYKALQTQWAKLFPEVPFQGGLQEDVWGGYRENIGVHGKVWRVVAFITIILTTLGLYGLVTLNVAGRVREFSIRKVLGAGVKNIAQNIANQYAILFAVALMIGAPISFILTKSVINFAYAYHMPITYSGVSIAVVILVVVLVTTVATQIGKVLRSNPVNGLKSE